MNIYEINILVPAEFSEKEIQTMTLDIERFVQDNGGILIEERKKRSVDLGYPVKDKVKAVLIACKFQIGSDKIKGIEQSIKEKDGILRFLLEKKKKPREISERKKRRTSVGPAETETKKEKAKVELKAIEEKLEEILNES